MFVDPCFEEFDSFDGDYIPLGRLNAFEDSAGNQGMNDRFQFRQGGWITENDASQFAAVDLPIAKCEIGTKTRQDGFVGRIAREVGFLRREVCIDRQSAKICQVLQDDAFTGGNVACETDDKRCGFHYISISKHYVVEEKEGGCYNLGMLAERITQSLIKDCGVNPELPLVVGVSGGADSLCLVHCLREGGFKLIVGHLDHALRESSAAQANALSQRMAELGLPFFSERQDVGQFALQNKLGIEEAARLCRYRFLFKLAREHGAQGVVVGHHADDQVETVLMHFLRGSGLSGLTGMQPRSILSGIDPELPLFRPMLQIYRQEIQEYCQVHDLEVLEDESNADLSFFRNHLRHELIPQLEQNNPGFRRALVRTALTLSADRQLLETLADEAFGRALVRTEKDGLVFSREVFLGLHLSLQRLVIRQAFVRLSPESRDLGFEAVERALAAITSGTAQTPLAGGLWVFCFESEFVIAPRTYQHWHRDYPQLTDLSGLKLKRGGKVKLNAGWELTAELIDVSKYKSLPEELKTHPLHAWLNPLDLEWPLEVRPMQTGERWSPLGMVLKHQKLSDFFVNQKIPRSARARWPLVLSGGSILWVAGLRIAQAWRLLGDENEILHLQLHAPDQLIDPVKLK